MKKTLALIPVVISVALLAWGQEPQDQEEPPQASTRFEPIDVFIEAGEQPLAAYQFEFAAETGDITIVGVEGGEHAAFREAPYYDPKALHQEGRILIATFNTGDDLPAGKTRVARVHVMVTGETEPEYVVRLHVSAAPDGTPIPAVVSCEKFDSEEGEDQ